MTLMDHIVLLLSCIADIFICYDFFKGFFNPRRQLRQHRMLVLGLGFILLLYGVNLLGSVTLNLIITPLVVLLYLSVGFAGRIVSKLMLFFLTMSVMLGAEFIFVVLLGVTNTANNINLSAVPFATFGTKLIAYIILMIIRQLAHRRTHHMVSRVFWLYLLIPIASLGLMLAAFHAGQEALADPEMKFYLTLCFALMLFANILVFAAFQSYSEELYDSMQKENLLQKEQANKQYYSKVSEVNEERRALIHDMKHYLSGLRGLLVEAGNADALAYLQQINSRLDSNELIIFSHIPLLDAILTEKQALAEAQGITFTVQVDPGVRLHTALESDYMAMLGNLLDNALRGAANAPADKRASVHILAANQAAFMVTKLVNTYDPHAIKQAQSTLLTTKANPAQHGIGLKSVQKTADALGGMLLTEQKENEFIATLMLPEKQ